MSPLKIYVYLLITKAADISLKKIQKLLAQNDIKNLNFDLLSISLKID